MAKYDPLREYLIELPVTTTQVILTFQQIEKIIGQNMEPAARKWLRAWDNTPGAPRQDSWLDVGWEVTMADLENEKARFQRIVQKARQSNRGTVLPPPKSFTIKCAYSNGMGLDPSPANITGEYCRICKGTGSINLPGSREDYDTCEICKGTGRDLYGIDPWKPCSICHGSGVKVR